VTGIEVIIEFFSARDLQNVAQGRKKMRAKFYKPEANTFNDD